MAQPSKKHSFDKPFMGFGTPKDPATQSAIRTHFVAATGEFVGTFQFLLFAYLGHLMAVDQAGDTGPNGTNSASTVIYISMSYGLSLLVTAWAFYRISGGLFNPAVTLGLVITGGLPPMRGLILIPAQIIGAICAAAVASGIVPGNISTVDTTLAPGVSSAQGVFLEMFLTAKLVFVILMLAVEKSKDTYLAPIGIGLALFVAEIAGVYYTGASLNPARSFAPCVISGKFQTYHWIYWIGPILGALISGGYYHFVKYFNYEEANPGQDSADGAFDPKIERIQSGQFDEEDGRGMGSFESRLEEGGRSTGAGGPSRPVSNGQRTESRGKRPGSGGQGGQRQAPARHGPETSDLHPGFPGRS